MFLWGAGWSALKILTELASLEVVLFWRFFLMSISFIPILYFMKVPLRLNMQSSKFILSSSVLNISFMVFSYLGLKSGFAGNGGVIITTLTPFVTFLIVGIFFKVKFKPFQYFGLLLGLLGGAIILEINKVGFSLSASSIYFVLCAVVWAGVTLLSQYSHKHIHPIHYSFYISVVATIATFFYSYDAGLLVVFELGSKFWIALIYIAVLGQSVATTIFFVASARLGSETTSSYMFLVPIFALVVAWVVLGEELQSHIIIGGTITLIAIYFINKKR